MGDSPEHHDQEQRFVVSSVTTLSNLTNADFLEVRPMK